MRQIIEVNSNPAMPLLPRPLISQLKSADKQVLSYRLFQIILPTLTRTRFLMVRASIFFSTSDIIYFIKEKEEIYTKH